MLSKINFFDYNNSVHIDQCPVYSIDFDNSQHGPYQCVNNECVFMVEQGSQFYLKLNLRANPMPTTVTVYKNDRELVYSPFGTIYVGVDHMRINSVTQSHTGRYRMSSRNFMGEGSITFQLNVQGKSHPYSLNAIL